MQPRLAKVLMSKGAKALLPIPVTWARLVGLYHSAHDLHKYLRQRMPFYLDSRILLLLTKLEPIILLGAKLGTEV